MAFWVKRILLKSGELVTERELRTDENYFVSDPPFVGDEISVICRGRSFRARVVWGYWPKDVSKYKPSEIIPLRVQEI